MMKSENTSPILLKKLDEVSIAQYCFLKSQDEIYYLGEYTTKKDYKYSKWNDLISNYKKEINKKGTTEWKHKQKAIEYSAHMLHSSIFNTKGISERASRAILVPIPPSEAKNSATYDDRNLSLLKLFMPQGNIQEIVLQHNSREALHKNPHKQRKVDDLQKNYYLNPAAKITEANELWLFDDLLTKGTHFRAIHNFLIEKFPRVKIVGFYIARSVYPSE